MAKTYTKPRFFTKILDHDGNVLIDNTPQTHTVLKDTTAWLITSAMKDVMTQGTGVAANISNMPVAGKSGTTTKTVTLYSQDFLHIIPVLSGADMMTTLR